MPTYLGSAEHIPCDDATYDIVFGVAMFYLIQDPDAAFRECHRILKPGGSLLIFDYQRHILNGFLPPHRGQVWNFGDIRDRLLAQAGFSRRRIRERSHWGLNILQWRLANSGLVLASTALNRNANQWLIVHAQK